MFHVIITTWESALYLTMRKEIEIDKKDLII